MARMFGARKYSSGRMRCACSEPRASCLHAGLATCVTETSDKQVDILRCAGEVGSISEAARGAGVSIAYG
jgi:hypothetical protein